jgi:D-3-phosphoglycerate dehydrogenase / 2-oxoglutarate reductase
MRRLDVAVIGDRFMQPQVFVAALPGLADGIELRTRTLELPWPDVAMQHGYAGDDLEGLKEFVGEPSEIEAFIGDAEILVNHLAPITSGMLSRLTHLKLIAVCRGGPVNIAMAAARRAGITLVSTPGRNAAAVAEFTIGMILAETRLITVGHTSLAAGAWRGDLYRADMTGDELSALTVGVVGYGHIGTRVVRLLRAFGCRILVTDPYVRLSDDDSAHGVRQVVLDELLLESDVVSLHARVTPETTGFIGRRELALMKKSAYLINTARGPLVDYDALYDALAGKRIRGAGLETFAVEPVPADWPLLRLGNVTLTPHIAGASLQTVRRSAEMIAVEIRRYLSGEPPLNPA